METDSFFFLKAENDGLRSLQLAFFHLKVRMQIVGTTLTAVPLLLEKIYLHL